MQFFLIYIREAHAIDSSWPMDFGLVEDPLEDGERRSVASRCVRDLGLEGIPALVDRVDDAVSRAWDAWPDRLYVIGTDGRVAYAGGPGPFEFKPDLWAGAIADVLAGATSRASSESRPASSPAPGAGTSRPSKE